MPPPRSATYRYERGRSSASFINYDSDSQGGTAVDLLLASDSSSDFPSSPSLRRSLVASASTAFDSDDDASLDFVKIGDRGGAEGAAGEVEVEPAGGRRGQRDASPKPFSRRGSYMESTVASEMARKEKHADRASPVKDFYTTMYKRGAPRDTKGASSTIVAATAATATAR